MRQVQEYYRYETDFVSFYKKNELVMYASMTYSSSTPLTCHVLASGVICNIVHEQPCFSFPVSPAYFPWGFDRGINDFCLLFRWNSVEATGIVVPVFPRVWKSISFHVCATFGQPAEIRSLWQNNTLFYSQTSIQDKTPSITLAML